MSFKTLNENPRYQINEYGDIWDTKRLKYLKVSKTQHNNPYSFVGIYNYETGKPKIYYVHHLVMKYFGGHKPGDNYEIDHLDGDKSNNYVYNLDWVTPKENKLRAKALGLSNGGRPKGTKNPVKKALYEKKKKGAPKRTELVKSLHWNIIDSRNDPYLFEQEIKQAIINFYEYEKIGNADGAYRLYKKLLDKGIDLAKEEEYIIAKYFINHPWKNDQILAKFNKKYEN